jgi:RNA polymerase-binding transcription factor DksA
MAATKKSSPATKAAAKKAPAKKPAAKKAAAKKAPATKAAAKKAPAKKVPAANQAPAKKPAAKKAPVEKAPAKKAATAPAAKAPTSAARKPRQPGATSLTPSLLSNAKFERVEIPAPRGHTKDGIAYTKDFDVKFLKDQRDELLARRAAELARATRLEDEATSIIEDGEMGDVQFDDEGGEGDTMVVQRDLDRVLSTQARQTILEIDAALARIEQGTYGYSEVSGQPIPRERLEAIPETTVLAAEKVSGVGPR